MGLLTLSSARCTLRTVTRPTLALSEMQRVCKPHGKILLLEHGRGYFDFLNEMLDGGAHQHASKWGCWWNRPIGELLEGTTLVVETTSRWHFGTTWMVVASPCSTEVNSVQSRRDEENERLKRGVGTDRSQRTQSSASE